ncbi:hypothetical protein GMSM_19370 [Geomonas sp. Red276]
MRLFFGRGILAAVAFFLLTFGTGSAALASTLSGTVYGGSRALPNATVTLSNESTAAQVGSVTTDANGFYSFTVGDGTYDLSIAPPSGSSFGQSLVKAISVAGADVTQNVVLVSDAILLSGKVVTSTGTGIQNLLVQLNDQASGRTVAQVYTDANGGYSFPVSAATYSINVYGGSLYTGYCGADGSYTQCVPNVPTPQSFYGYNLVYNLAVASDTTKNITIPIVTLSGKTVDGGGNPLGNVVIAQSSSISATSGSYTVYNNSSSYPVKSDASGNYSMSLIAGNGYSMTLTPPAGNGVGLTVLSGISVTADTTRDLALNPLVNLSGKVSTSGGTGIQNLLVQLNDQATGRTVSQGFTDANGNYSFAVGSGSTYAINVYGGSLYYGYCGANSTYQQCVPNVPAPQTFYGYNLVRNLTVTGNTTQDITIPIVTLSGKTTGGGGAPVGNVVIAQAGSISTSAGSYNVYNNSSTYPVKSDASGNYSMSLIGGNGYSMTLTPPSGAGVGLTAVSGINAPTDTTRDLVLKSLVTLSGKVALADGTGVKNVLVQVSDQASGTTVAQGFSDADGHYSYQVGSGGTYYINLYGGSLYWGYCGTDGSYTQCAPNVPAPQTFYGYYVVRNLTVTADTTQNMTLPIVTLSGKTTDANGVGIANVLVSQSGSISTSNGSFNVYNDSSSSPVKSDASGNYSMSLIAGSGYSETITPPSASFAQTILSGISVTRNTLQNIILPYRNTTAPKIISGPTASSITSSGAVVQWQTDKPTQGGVKYGTANPPTSTLEESGYVTNHSAILSGLSANTLYYLSVYGKDAAGNEAAASEVVSFTTEQTKRTLPPVFTVGPDVTSITQNGATITWTTDEPTTGVISYGTTPFFGKTASDTTLSTSHTVTVTGLDAATKQYFKVTATDNLGNPSTDSSVIYFTTLEAPDTKAPVITNGPMRTSTTDTSVTITWITDEPATSGVSLNDGTNYIVYTDTTLTTSHSVVISKLTPSTAYSYVVSSTDAVGNGPTLSAAKSFTTDQAADTTAPVFTQVPIVKNTTHQSADLYWVTDEPSSCSIEYGTGSDLGQSDSKAALITKHNRPLTGLLPGTTYYFRVKATDAAGNYSYSKTASFTTDVIPRTAPPVITRSGEIVYSSDTTATVAFSTDEPCNTVVEYGPNGSTANRASNSDKVTDHQVALTNLTANTSYSVQVSCTDMAGNTVVASAGKPSTMMAFNFAHVLSDVVVGSTGSLGFTTASQPDTTPPVITVTPAATAVTTSMAYITWSTDKIADSQVFYGLPGQNTPKTAGDIVQVTGHSVALTNLAPNTAYEFKVQSTDPSNNTVVSSTYTFTTASAARTAPPVITAISASAVTSSQILVTWTTDEPATTLLNYGTNAGALTAQASVAGLTTTHAVTLYNLVPGTTYYLVPGSTDSFGNSAQGSLKALTLAGLTPVSYTVSTSAGAGGSLSPATQTIYGGYQLALAVTPQFGYQVGSVTGCGGTLSGNVYTTAAVTANCTVSATFTPDPTVTGTVTLTTVARPAGGTYAGGTLLVQLVNGDRSANVYYTTDGSTPSTASRRYLAPIPVSGNVTLKYFAQDGTATEQVKSATYTAALTGQPAASFAGLVSGTTFTVSRSEGGSAPVSVYSGSQTSFVDSGTLKPNTTYTYSVSSDTGGDAPLLTIRTPLYNGWNVVGVPFDTSGVTAASVFATPVSAVYQWIPTGASAESSNSVLGSYRTVTSLAPGNGYFVKANNGSTMLAYSGNPVSTPVSVNLLPGWTMISNPTQQNLSNLGAVWKLDGVSLADAINAGTVGGGLYWWNGTTYDSWSIIGDNPQVEPWKGYWILNLDGVAHTLTIR